MRTWMAGLLCGILFASAVVVGVRWVGVARAQDAEQADWGPTLDQIRETQEQILQQLDQIQQELHKLVLRSA